MNAALSAALSVVGKALAPIADGVLEAWAASKNLGANVEALRMELLLVKDTLENASSKDLDGRTALKDILQKLRDSAQKAENMLDELDYFRIHDELNGTFDAADENPKGCSHDLVQNARHTAKAFGKLFSCATAGNPREEDAIRRGASAPSTSLQDGEEVRGRKSKLGNLFPCSCKPNVHDGDNTAKPILSNNDEEKYILKFRRVEVSNSMKRIVEDLQHLRKEVSTILLCCSPSGPLDLACNRPVTTHEIIEPKLYGRDVIVNSIIYDITKGKYSANDLTVLPIVGVGGIGKTTMTQHIYKNNEVQSHFDVVIWVSVSLNFDHIKLLEKIIKKLPKVEGEKDGTAGEIIAQRLKSKRILLIMDDMWECSNEDDWKRLVLPFKNSQKCGNIIMVTTRLPKLAQMIKTTNHSIELRGLESDEFRKLFLAFVFSDEQHRMDHTWLLEIGYKIIKKLKGSPLAAKTVGRLLKKDLNLRHWTNVLESKEWEAETADHDIMPALKLSYDYLPFRLQQCFSCCALYPEDYMFTSNELIRFWIGVDNLISGSRNKRGEDIGLNNLNELVTYGFFRRDEINGNTRYIIHDLLHNLASKVASQDSLSLHRSNVKTVQIPLSTRHLSIIIDSLGNNNAVTRENFKSELLKLKTMLKVENLQTLLIFGKVDKSFGHIFHDLFEKANDLRVLHLTEISSPMEYMFHNFSTFIHLRYLLIGTHMTEMQLPSVIFRFYHLRILDLERWDGTLHLPIHFSNLAKLRHFPTSNNEIFHSSISYVGKLQCLQELNKFIVDKEDNGFEINQLGHLADLAELGVYNLERVHTKETAAKAKLMEKIHLDNLTLQWEFNNEPDKENFVLERLQPYDNLRRLKIIGHKGHSCPAWMGSKLSVKALKYLHLEDVAWEILPSLGEMWELDELHLERIHTFNEFPPKHFGPIMEQSFCNLKKLALIGLKRLEKWVAGDAPQSFSGLQVLTIEECPELVELPFINNMHFLPKLEEFNMNSCRKLMSLPPIPWTHTLCKINIIDAGWLKYMTYKKSSSRVELGIYGRGVSRAGVEKEMILVSSNLTELQELEMRDSQPLVLTDLKMLTSLKKLSLYGCKIVTGVVGDSVWQVPIETLVVWECDVSGEVLTQMMCGLTRLRELSISSCDNIALLDVGVEKQHTLCFINIEDIGLLSKLKYSKKSSQVQLLEISGISNETRVDAMIPVSSNLTELQGFVMSDNPPPVLMDLKMLSSLKELSLERCKIMTGFVGDSVWQIPIEELRISACDVSGEVLTQMMCGLTRLRKLSILCCQNIVLLDVGVEKQQMASSSADETEDTKPIDPCDQCVAAEEDEIGGDAGLLLLPSHFADHLEELDITCCRNLTLIAPGGHKRGGNRGGGLQSLRSLRKLDAMICPKLLSAYSSSSCCPFPSSLKELDLHRSLDKGTLELLSNLTSLTKLEVAGDALRSEGLWHLLTVGQLSKLDISICPNFFVDWFPHEDEQEQLLLSRSSKLQELTTWEVEGFLRAPVCRVLSFSLTILCFQFCREVEGFTKEQAEALQLLTSLQELKFLSCEQLRSLPEGLNKLTSLKTLSIVSCPNIACLPEDGLPGSLQILDVRRCDNDELKGQCRQLTGTIPEIET